MHWFALCINSKPNQSHSTVLQIPPKSGQLVELTHCTNFGSTHPSGTNKLEQNKELYNNRKWRRKGERARGRRRGIKWGLKWQNMCLSPNYTVPLGLHSLSASPLHPHVTCNYFLVFFGYYSLFFPFYHFIWVWITYNRLHTYMFDETYPYTRIKCVFPFCFLMYNKKR